MSVAFAMECFENGLIDERDTGGIELRFGSGEAMVKMVEQIGKREGFGKLLGEGVKRAAAQIGKGAERFAQHVKGQELPLHDPRGKIAVGLGFALSETGADHLVIGHDSLYQDPEGAMLPTVAPLGIWNAMPATDLSAEKVRFYYYLESIVSLGKMLDLCYFVFVPRTPVFTLDRLVELVNAVTGWDTSLWELMKAGERGVNLARVFNVREGFSRADDKLPKRLFEGLGSGRLQGRSVDREEFENALTLVYEMKGWDPATAKPRRARLVELDIAWAYEAMEEGGQ
jgi:aldehyde:ferredoxin oxidoreductase